MKLWLIVIRDKETAGEPDVGMAFVERNERAANTVRDEMERVCIKAGRARCTGRVREVLRSKHYRAPALVRTGK